MDLDEIPSDNLSVIQRTSSKSGSPVSPTYKFKSPRVYLTKDEYRELSDIFSDPNQINGLPITIVVQTDIRLMLAWKDVMSLVFQYLDFRMLMVLGLVSKSFLELTRAEKKRRKQWITDCNNFYSSPEHWFWAKRCAATEGGCGRHGKWEEICSLGAHNLCRTCTQNLENRIAREAEENRIWIRESKLQRIRQHSWNPDPKGKIQKVFLGKNA